MWESKAIKKEKKGNRSNYENAFEKKFNLKETSITAILFLSASLAIVISAAIIYTLAEGAFSFFSNPLVNPLEFFIGDKWVPSGGNPKFGVLPLLSGSILISGGVILMGGPIGIGAALFLSEFAGKRLRIVAKPVIEVLAGVPSIVYGFFALLFISPILRDVFGASYFNAASAIIVMSIMILPIVVSVSDDSMRAVPMELRAASLAMGATRWETATRVVLPSAASGITASIILGLARAIGETMVVTLAAGSVAKLTFNPLEEVQTMTSYIAQVATGDIPPGVAVEAAFAVGLLLFVITYLINMAASLVVEQIQTGQSKKEKGIIKRYLGLLILELKNFLNVVTDHLKIRDSSKGLTLKRRKLNGQIGVSIVSICLLIAVIFLFYLLSSILTQGLGGINWNFLTNIPSSRPAEAGIFPVILGSIYLMLLTMVFSIPVGVLAAVYLTEIAKDTRHVLFLRRIIQNMAGVPSIVFGLSGLAIFVRLFDFGPSLISGSLTLAIMALPMIVVVTEEALKSVPQSFREAARGVGATRWQTIKHHVLPNALPGILTGTVLALSRAIGETAPILFIGSVFSKVPPSGIFDSFLALPLTIFYWTRHPNPQFHDLAASTIIVLLVILLTMNTFAIFYRQRTQERRNW
ncbi:MAG: phosphate ABC transporter permease PstA [Halobacteriota archaeon]|nr:phosphate ABC transporter permease PstA [Halobacteriota archaeon]